MRAMQLQKPADITTEPLSRVDLDAPEPDADFVRIKVHCCAVCRTDLHVVEGDLPTHKMPIIPGHQTVGTVDAVGEGVDEAMIGRRVGAAWLGHTCGTCEYCRRDRENLCPNAAFNGWDHDGGYAEFATARQAFVYDLPDGFDDVHAAPLLCAGIIGYRAMKRAEVPDGGHVAMVGFGSSAHLVLPIALRRGWKVSVVTRSANHQKLARDLGAAWVGDDAHDAPEKFDSAIIFAPAGPLVPALLERLKPGGTLSMAGIHMSPIPEMDYRKHVYHERDLQSVMNNTREDGRNLLREAADAGVEPRVTEYDLADANRALRDMKQSKLDGTAVLMVA